ncbi:hypothetical protein ACRE_084000 [Hapsidospora chrysogenum ATCC 11550]|uniref:Uncharacterized protein n=1 Tax=Hapsidospora chrysogenum (strain ATCC 11550 / CBS 779.69 / DSM 880 / IAM 14645 / JCM 23072 / IMI 49137) TaxID=857340 RepID=A0A086SUW0_HAPC1|nr:hypothetical protein ACRE_084000 [Hapsidospora chrysogenum ATCC 11550]
MSDSEGDERPYLICETQDTVRYVCRRPRTVSEISFAFVEHADVPGRDEAPDDSWNGDLYVKRIRTILIKRNSARHQV